MVASRYYPQRFYGYIKGAQLAGIAKQLIIPLTFRYALPDNRRIKLRSIATTGRRSIDRDYGLPKTWFEERGREGAIARTKPGRYVLFKRRDVEAYFERNKNGKIPQA